MKLLRYGPLGQELPGILDGAGRIRSLHPAIADITPAVISPEGLRVLQAIDPEKLPLAEGTPRIGVPVAGIRQFVAVGLNYRKHAEEAGLEIPKEPVIFNKALTSLSGPNDNVMIPSGAEMTDWEVELGFIIGRTAHYVAEKDALAHVAGYCVANDVSERHWQLHRAGQWGKGKSFDTFAPIGPWLVTQDEIPDPQTLELSLQVNGKRQQGSNTSDMIFSVAWLVSYISQFMTLLPGDLIITGTPAGVGLGMKPPRFLKAGDVMTVSVSGLGEQRQRVVAASD